MTNPKYEPYRIDILLDRKCNLSCKNCITNNQINFHSENSVLNFVDFALNNLITKNKIYIHFTGGEPFLQIDKIKKTINHIKQKRLIDNEIKYSVYSNLTILNEKIINLLKENNIQIHSSIDGLKKENDIIRGENTFEKVINNIEKLRKQNIRVNSITTTLKNENYKKVSNEFIKLLVNLEIKVWRLNIDYYGIETKS